MQSLPSRERGLKSRLPGLSHLYALSLPSRERGLKLVYCRQRFVIINVAPLAGAWIEISHSTFDGWTFQVAPLAGAWIEINFLAAINVARPSLPSRERGLKSFATAISFRCAKRRSPRGSVD